jgi:hypothetical protein
MKQRVGNAHGDQSVRFAWEKRVGRDDFRCDARFLMWNKWDVIPLSPVIRADS